MELDLKKVDRDALFGCLLAVLEKVERDTYDREETREHNAIRLQSMYCHRPMRTFRQLNDQLDRAYFPKLKPWLRSRYRNLIGDIIYQINCRCDGDSWDAPLKETYLIGYYLQRRALYTKTDQTDTKDSDKEELYAGASPALMGACAQRDVSLAFCTPRGRFLARVSGESSGNVLLRRTQYRIADDPGPCCRIARNMIFGKVHNARWSIERTRRDHGLRVDGAALSNASAQLRELLPQIATETSLEQLRDLEGASATVYFGVFDQMILGEKPLFAFSNRNRRPPLDPVNALLSFAYSLLTHDCASALESVGLDAYVGFLHRDRPGRTSLALDLMEELRPCLADRFVLTLINNRIVSRDDFEFRENGAVYLTDSGRKACLSHWQERKKAELKHPYLGEKIPWGLVPYVQALLMARTLRDDLEGYPPFLWK